MKKLYVFLFLLVTAFAVSNSQSLNYKLSGYLDTYYAIDNDGNFDALSTNTRPYSYVNKQKDEFRLNVAQFQGQFSYENRVRGIITLHTGDLLHTAWEDAGATDPTLQQANGGFMVFENVWIDAGYFLTHIGGELLLPKDNWLSSHSLVTYFEPFYQTGVRVSYETPTLTAQLHVLNGNGIFEDNNYNKSVGVFLSYNLTDEVVLAYGNVIGNEIPGDPSLSRLQMFHNFDVYYTPAKDFRLKGQVDFASLAEKDSIKAQSYMGVSVEGQYFITDKYAATLRGSYITTSNKLFWVDGKGFENGNEIALGLQYKPADMIYCRIEGRMISFDDEYKPFRVDNKDASSRMEIMLNFGIVLE